MIRHCHLLISLKQEIFANKHILKMDRLKKLNKLLTSCFISFARAFVFIACFLYGTSPNKAENFTCGQDICHSKGYTVCISPPLVSTLLDSYCMPCETFEGTCGSADEQTGCHLYCRDLVTQELEKKNIKLHSLEQRIVLLEKDNKDSTTGLVVSVCVNVLLLIVILVLCGFYRHRRAKYSRRNSDKPKSISSSDTAATFLLTPSSGSSATSIDIVEVKNGDTIEEKNGTKDADNGISQDVESGCYGDNKLHNVNPVQSEHNFEMAVN